MPKQYYSCGLGKLLPARRKFRIANYGCIVRTLERFGLPDPLNGGYAGSHEAPALNEDSLAMQFSNDVGVTIFSGLLK
jgi:hypothetical protein